MKLKVESPKDTPRVDCPKTGKKAYVFGDCINIQPEKRSCKHKLCADPDQVTCLYEASAHA